MALKLLEAEVHGSLDGFVLDPCAAGRAYAFCDAGTFSMSELNAMLCEARYNQNIQNFRNA